MAPGYETRRMRKLAVSATTIELPEARTATLRGWKKLAEVPEPSERPLVQVPDTQWPASVETAPPIPTSRMQWFALSATTMKPFDASTATPCGWLKLAAMPTPSAKFALPLPATVETIPDGVICLMQLFIVSATRIALVNGSTATPAGANEPGRVETIPLFGGGKRPPTTSARACGETPAPASPAAPHSSTAAYVAGAAHLTHAATLHEALPVGKAAGALAPGAVRYVPLASTSAPPAAPRRSAVKAGATTPDTA
jgi:hypothetical protein